MPFYNGEAHQTDCFAETIDVLQSVIEQFGAICPLHIIGDFNAQLPKRRLLHRRWYRLPGFNTHSSILYDFINDNDLCVADFTDSPTRTIYIFPDSTATYTWIDHCLITSQHIVSCNIIPRHAYNVSDQLPLCLQTRVLSEQCQPAVLSTDVPYGVPRRWDNLECTNAYRDILHSKLSTMHILTCDANDDSDAIQEHVDCYVEQLNDAMHDAVCDTSRNQTETLQQTKNILVP